MKRLLSSLALACLLGAGMAAAETGDSQYVIGAGDVLQLNVWQVPSLDRQLEVRADGVVVLPMAGEIRAAGMTVEQLEQQIVKRLRDFNRNVTEVSLSVTEFKSRSIYVLGRVVSPGKYAYADAINLFDLIREAGGFSEDALKSRVKVVHRSAGEETIEYANVELALNTGTLDKLPKVRSGDTVLVPKRTGNSYAGSGGVQLIGAVRSPSIYPIEEIDDLVGILLLAGGPDKDANLKHVKLVRKHPQKGTVAYDVNVQDYLENGSLSQNPECEPGDTIFVPRKTGSFYRTLRTVSLAIGTVASGIGLYYVLSR
jgi:polysaccharide export outer membrane protein